MRRRFQALISVLALFVIGCSTPPAAKTEGDSSESANRQPADVEQSVPLYSGLNVHSHPVSTPVPDAQRYFDQGLVLAFGFNFAEAARSFRQAQRYDPTCAMCYWGEALVLGPNYNSGMPEENVPVAWEAIQRAQKLADEHATPRERAYIDALSKRYGPSPVDDRTSRDQAYAEAMGNLADKYPDDHDATTMHAEALMIAHPWDLWEQNGDAKPWTPEILSILEGVIDAEPNHPLANHLYIHATEASDHPERALASARRLEDMVPGAGHLLHMPAHTYIRTGDYHRASEATRRGARADERYLSRPHAEGEYPLAYYPHNYHFLWATTTMEGRSEAALEAAREVRSQIDPETMRRPGLGTLQHYWSIPYYARTIFGKWEAILEMDRPADDLPYPTGVWHFARGMAELRTGDTDAGTSGTSSNSPTTNASRRSPSGTSTRRPTC
ncbi:MAG: tetratricopeptide repeat protein [Bradymonadaceae bacterium]